MRLDALEDVGWGGLMGGSELMEGYKKLQLSEGKLEFLYFGSDGILVLVVEKLF